MSCFFVSSPNSADMKLRTALEVVGAGALLLASTFFGSSWHYALSRKYKTKETNEGLIVD